MLAMYKKVLLLLILFGGVLYAEKLPKESERKVISYIDKLVMDGLSAKKLRPNSAVSNEVFLKRTYLDIVGRIPTLNEYEMFMSKTSANRRNELIDQLFESPGYVSHSFNYWADALRATSKMNKSNGWNYLHWIKKSIKDNKPYDDFVREMVAAEGALFKHGNGATGYYMRDFNMPLDNISNTMQIFLATSMVCAQCHDHPYKKWTQMDFYKLAAFTNGTETNSKNIDNKVSKNVAGFLGKSGKNNNNVQKMKPLRPLFQGVYNSGTGKIKLPEDYDYDDAKPNQEVVAGVPYGPLVKFDLKSANGAKKRIYEFRFDRKGFAKNVNSRKYLAEWVTSSENPMFTKTIVNRLWKRVMGIELVGDLTDMKESELGTNPKLTQFLINLMKKLNYDQKEFMKLVFKTQTYQRTASNEVKGKYYFQGPVLSRMSAEQVHDSLLSLRVDNPDKNSSPPAKVIDNLLYEELSKKSPKQIADYLKNTKSFMSKLSKSAKGQIASKAGKARSYTRASEMTSPMKAGSMLRTFGQSSREIIDDSSLEANIPQALTMMNDDDFSFKKTSLSQKVNSEKSLNKKIEVIFKAVLCRRPSNSEMEIMKRHSAKGLTIEDLYWSLVNSHEFKLRM